MQRSTGFSLWALAALLPFADVEPILRTLAPQLNNEAEWNDWASRQNTAIRARLEQGDRDSMVNLLLFGTSFTRQPRIRIEDLAEASRSGLLRARVDDLLKGIRNPSGNDRLAFLRTLISDPDSPQAGVFILQNLERVLKELREYGGRKDRSRVFYDRGVSLDTSILPNFAIEQALSELKPAGIRRAAVIGPGLDFVDWDAGYDYYPQQMLQPFGLYDSLLRLGLADHPSITVIDISARSLDHLRRARQGGAYTVQLPRDPARQWTAATVEQWRRFGDRIGTASTPLNPPALLKGIETRAVKIRPEVVAASEPVDLNIVLERANLPPFDLIVATNVFVYYDTLEQTLALQNIASMLKPGGYLLVNSELRELPEVPMRLAGATRVSYTAEAGDRILWYRRP